MGNVAVGRVGAQTVQETVARPDFRRSTEDHMLCRPAEQSGKKQYHKWRHIQPVFRHERLILPIRHVNAHINIYYRFLHICVCVREAVGFSW